MQNSTIDVSWWYLAITCAHILKTGLYILSQFCLFLLWQLLTLFSFQKVLAQFESFHAHVYFPNFSKIEKLKILRRVENIPKPKRVFHSANPTLKVLFYLRTSKSPYNIIENGIWTLTVRGRSFCLAFGMYSKQTFSSSNSAFLASNEEIFNFISST